MWSIVMYLFKNLHCIIRNYSSYYKQVVAKQLNDVLATKLELKPWIILIVWLLFITLSFSWNLYQVYDTQKKLALETARSFFQQILITRTWNALHNGVYVPVTPETPPNPYLKTDDRDIIVSDQLTLTKINPAYMTRQLSEIANKKNGIQFHITSLKPLRPDNAPTDWEAGMLREFEQGVTEKGEFISRQGHWYYRYMAPLTTEKPCLTCHADQGYQIGDIRGGISVTLAHIEPVSWLPVTLTHITIGLLGGIAVVALGILLQRSHDKLRHQALIDALTQIPNRRYFSDRLPEEWRRAQRYGWSIVVILCDIDYFKRYNDSLGHQAGDQCLTQVAQTIHAHLRRGGDFCARYGGEEFVIVLVNSTTEHAMQRAETIRAAVANLNLHHPQAPLNKVTMSLGVAINETRSNCIHHEQLIKYADEALYRAKQRGRNCVELY
jgi:diguanylate cyclase (GGDEF)-like protein